MQTERNPNKPFISKDTKQPLVVFGGYEINELGGLIQRPIKCQAPQLATPEDVKLYNESGIAGLKKKQFFGVLDRLKNVGITE